MYLEQRIEQMEETIKNLKDEILKLQSRNADEILTPKEFAQRAKLSENTVYLWIRSGQIKVLPNLGTALRIPMSQFYDEDAQKRTDEAVTKTKADELRNEFRQIVRNRKVR